MRVLFLLTLAGKGERFFVNGYKGEKFLLPIFGRTILEQIIEKLEIPNYFEKYIIIRRQQLNAKQRTLLNDIAQRYSFGIYEIDSSTSQYCTLVKGLKETQIKGYHLLFVHNGDTVVEGVNLGLLAPKLIEQKVGYIDTFYANENIFSYVTSDSSMKVTEIREKEVISQMASSGLYAFPGSVKLTCCVGYQSQRPEATEVYISDVINRMIRSDTANFITMHRTGRTTVLGTPAQYQAALQNINYEV